MREPENISRTIIPLSVANFLCGLAWIFEHRINYTKQFLSVLYSICCIIGFIISSKIALTEFFEIYYKDDIELGQTTFRAVFYINTMLTVSILILGWLRLKAMRGIISQAINCDESMEKLGMPKNYKKLFRIQLYWLGAVLAVVLIFLTMNCIWTFSILKLTFSNILIMLVLHYPVALMGVADVSFYYWVRYTKMKLHQLNDLLRGMLTTTPDSPQHKRVLAMKYDRINKEFSSIRDQSRTSNDNTETIKAVKQVHLELVKSARHTNEAYGMQILVTMTGSFILITGLLYKAYTLIWSDIPRDHFMRQMVPVSLWILFYSSKIFIINHGCAKTSTEAANTGDIICELYEPSTTREFRAEIRDFTLQLIQNPLIFTACGFFDLDHTFIQGVIGSITTYLVILIQVGEMPKPELFSNTTEISVTNATV